MYNEQVAVNDGGEITVITVSDVMQCVQGGKRTKVTSDGNNNINVCSLTCVVA